MLIELKKPKIEEQICFVCKTKFIGDSGVCPDCERLFDSECVCCGAQCMSDELDEEGYCAFCNGDI